MLTPPSTRTSQLAKDVGWLDDFARLRDELLSRGLRDDIAVAQSFLDQAEATRSRRENCGLPEAKPACRVQIRYIYQVARGAPKEQVFAQTLLGFEVAAADKRVVAINYVQAEDGLASMTNYESQMMSIGFLRDFYPTVHTTLHACLLYTSRCV